MKFFCAIVLLSIAAASAVKDDDMWNFYKVELTGINSKLASCF